MNIEKEIAPDQNDLRALINNTNDLIWSVDRNYKLIASNKAFDEALLQMTGIPVIKGRDIFGHGISEDQATSYKAFYDRAFSGEAFKVKEYTLAFWSELSFYPIYKDGEITGTACYSHDITAQTIAEEKIKRSGASLKAIFENSSESFFLTDTDGIIIELNSNARKTNLLTCSTPMEAGSNILEYISEERKGLFSAMLSRAVAGEAIKYEQSFLDLNGGFHSYEFCISPVKEADVITGMCFNGRNITEQTLARERIEQNEKRLEAEQGKFNELFLQAPSCICILSGPHHIFEMANPNYVQLTGKKNIVGKSLAELFPEVESQGFLAMMDNIYETGAPFIANEQLISIFRDNDNELTDHYLNFVCQPYKNIDGAIAGIFFFANIVTEQVLARKKIEQNEARLEAERKRYSDLFLKAPSSICILRGPNHLFEMANPLYLKITGKKNIIGKTAIEVFPELADQGFATLLNNVYNTGIPLAGNEVFIQVDVDGSGLLTDHYMNFVYEPFKNSEGAIDGIFFFANIVTEQVLAREKIAHNEKRYRALVENGGDVVVIMAEDGHPLYVSPSVERILGYTEQEVMGLNLLAVLHPDDISEVQKTMGQVLLSPGIPVRGHTRRMQNKRGEWRWFEATITNMLHDPAIGGIVDNFRDITERVLADEKIKKANRLYSFISQINQTIVHAKNENEVFKEACRIAIEFGGFKMAWIGAVNPTHKKTTIVENCNIPLEDISLFTNATYADDGPLAHVVSTGTSFICNDIEHEFELTGWKQYAVDHGVRSVMILPIKLNGEITGSFNLYGMENHVFDEQEIMLLEEAAGDISFALSVFEKDRHRKQMEDKVIHSELQLNQAQAIAHLGSWDLNFASGLATWSDEACRIYGLEITDNLHSFDTWISFVHPEDRDHVIKEIDKERKTLARAAFHHRIMLRNGEVKHIYSQSEFELNTEGIPIGIHGVAHDLTEIKNAEAGLSRSEANLRLIMDLIPQSIFAKDYNGKYIFVNKSFASLHGLNTKDILDKPINELIPQQADIASFLKEDQEVILSGKTHTIPEHSFTDVAGNTRLFHTIKVPFTVAGTNEKAVLGITMDITKEKHAEEERTKMINDIVLRNKDLEQFSYIISHNLRAPVANMMGIAEVLQIPGLEKAEERMMIAELENSVKKIDEVIRDLNRILQIKHTENKKKEIILLSGLLHDIESGIDKNIKNKELQIVSDFSAIDELFTIKSYMYSILFNLISNSIKYRQAGTHPIIEIKTELLNNKLQLIYRDNGLGIDLKMKGDQVFGLYKRFHNHVEGKGMGLFIVKTHVESLGGKITIASEVNKGTSFLIEFDIIEQ